MTGPGRFALACVVGAAVLMAIALDAPAGADDGAQLPPPLPTAETATQADRQPTIPWSARDLAKRFPDPDDGADRATFSGTARCIECHEERDESLRTSFHAKLTFAKPVGEAAARDAAEEGAAESADTALPSARGAEPEGGGCEACHGAGREHSESDGDELIRHPWDVPAQEMIGVCIRCHADVLELPIDEHRDWISGAEDEMRSCTKCHEIHVDRTDPAHAEKTGPFATVKDLARVAQSIPAARCIECHDDFHPQMKRSGHADLLTEGAGCGSCHGNGSLHETSGGRPQLIVNPERQKARDADRNCTTCHGNNAVVQRWTCSEHAKEGTSCITCHDANAPRGRTLRKSEYELCGSCHLDVKASFRLPNGHKVARGRVACSDCHDPHDNPRRVRNRDVRLRACAKCHVEKAGPFVHDHGIKRSEGCIACHSPHGSVNDRLLTFRRMKSQCLQCHPETPHDLGQRRYDNCIACHVEIHGSDIDRLFLR